MREDEKVVSGVSLGALKCAASILSESHEGAARECVEEFERLIAAQHPPEPEVGWYSALNIAGGERVPLCRAAVGHWLRWEDGCAQTFDWSFISTYYTDIRALDLSALPGPGDEVATLERRVSELRAESARLQEWLSMIEGGDNPSDDAEQLRRWAFQALTLGKRVGDMESKSKGGGDA